MEGPYAVIFFYVSANVNVADVVGRYAMERADGCSVTVFPVIGTSIYSSGSIGIPMVSRNTRTTSRFVAYCPRFPGILTPRRSCSIGRRLKLITCEPVKFKLVEVARIVTRELHCPCNQISILSHVTSLNVMGGLILLAALNSLSKA
ncbi:hypothetical protein AVT69_gp143 [Pseudomonas phage PhiPA3]|uniref:Uncharacterized protein 145 n=1 Tax=Pseudomonas phage PhiPA3 TaxID=998086 RepID=F8SK18_BPPA3|nr:hypothetical protein AVT69_gp143 [Pseudomonas phage PhiPA3]AEH03568.1 hypothetical protein [Pseudomonas phage PhiPA3]